MEIAIVLFLCAWITGACFLALWQLRADFKPYLDKESEKKK